MLSNCTVKKNHMSGDENRIYKFAKVKYTNSRDFELANWDWIALSSNLGISEKSLACALGKFVPSIHRDEIKKKWRQVFWTKLGWTD